MKQFKIEVEKVSGFCSCGYNQGDTFLCQGMNTPELAFCGGAYMALFPIQVALYGGAYFNFEDNRNSKTKLACPDNGHVVFRITLIEQ